MYNLFDFPYLIEVVGPVLTASGDICGRTKFSQALVSTKPKPLGQLFSAGVETGDWFSHWGRMERMLLASSG